ncbi:MAG TPA: rRNA pseudouridine synthase [Acholeplasmataceae bacterium]|nr:rRNA pseudouridine synthase [Acholeplasmataceae bacterium]
MERLQKRIASSNIASRRQAEKMILEGRVKVNGELITELGVLVSKDDKITVDDKPIMEAENHYFLVNKPTGYVSSTKDEKNRKTVVDIIKEDYPNLRVYPVGRLDYDTAGLLLITNDGNLTQILTRPEYEVEKEYIVRVNGVVLRKTLNSLRNGVTIDENYFAKPKDVRIVEIDKVNKSTSLTIVLTEGKNRQVRKMFDAIGHSVKNLTRIRYDFLTLDGVARGKYRKLTIHEVRKLHRNQR